MNVTVLKIDKTIHVIKGDHKIIAWTNSLPLLLSPFMYFHSLTSGE